MTLRRHLLITALACALRGAAAPDPPAAAPPRGLADAHRLIADGSLYEAVESLKTGLETNPKDSAAQKLLALTLFRVREYAGAAAYAGTVLSDAPDDAEARRVLSLSVLLSELELDPENAPALLERGRLCAAGGLYGLAADHYRRYLERVSHDALARREYARILGWSGHAGMAVRQYGECLQSAPRDRELRLEMARLMNQSGMHRESARWFRELLAEDPALSAARMDLLRALAWDGDDEPCAQVLADLSADPGQLETAELVFASEQAARLARPAEAASFLRELEQREPRTAGVRERLARLEAGPEPAPKAAEEGDLLPAFRRELRERLQARHADTVRRAADWTARNPADLRTAIAAAFLLERTGDAPGALAQYARINAVKPVPLLRERDAFLARESVPAAAPERPGGGL